MIRECVFNYNFIYNILYCNLSLFRCKIRATKHCENCNHDVEYVHTFDF